MNWSRIRYLPVIAGILFLAACNGHKNNAAGKYVNPILTADPSLKPLTEQIDKSPKNASLYFDRGNMLHRMKLDSLALQDYKTAATLDTTKAEYYSAIGDLLFEHKDISGSVQWIQKAINLNPEDVKAHLKMAKLFLYIRDYTKGISETNIVLRTNPYNAEAYFLKGMIYKELKDTARALSNFETARNANPDYEDAVIQIALLYSIQKNPLAIKYFDNAFKIDSSDVFPLFAKGVYYQQQKDDADAKALFKECIVRNTHYVDAYFHMGYILLQEDSLEKAWRQYDIVVKIDPGNSSAYYDRGLCSELMDSTLKAVDDYRVALSIDSTYESPREGLRRLKGKLTKIINKQN